MVGPSAEGKKFFHHTLSRPDKKQFNIYDLIDWSNIKYINNNLSIIFLLEKNREKKLDIFRNQNDTDPQFLNILCIDLF